MTLSLLALLVVGGLLAWKFGSVVLRLLGVLVATIGLINLLLDGGSLPKWLCAAIMLLGALLWLAGHWLFAFRHHRYRSSLARRIFVQLLPAELEPTRNWGVPTVEAERRR